MQKDFDRTIGKILRETESRSPFSSSAPGVLLAVSGGMDSMCLAELFLHTVPCIRFELAHCNFHLRGEESDSDAELVARWGEKNGIRVNMTDFATEPYAREHGLSIEMAARELRYKWFAEVCRERGFCAVATGHHADDNAETMLLNLVRGTGLRGLAGMSEISALPFGGQDCGILLIRPLLGFTRDRIEGYVRHRRIGYHDDRTNADVKYRRNLIRHEVIPLLEKLNPSFVRTACREMKYFAQACAIADASMPECPADENGETRIGISELMSMPHREYFLYGIMERCGFNSSAVSSVEHLLTAFAEDGVTLAGKKFMSPSHVLVTSSSEIIIRPASDAEECGELLVGGPGRYRFGNAEIEVEVRSCGVQVRNLPAGAVAFDSEAFPFPFVCRRWRSGDWFRPLGMKGRKKLSDYFTDKKYDLFEKEEAIVIVSEGCTDGHVAAIAGERIDEGIKVTGDTANITVVRLIRQ